MGGSVLSPPAGHRATEPGRVDRRLAAPSTLAVAEQERPSERHRGRAPRQPSEASCHPLPPGTSYVPYACKPYILHGVFAAEKRAFRVLEAVFPGAGITLALLYAGPGPNVPRKKSRRTGGRAMTRYITFVSALVILLGPALPAVAQSPHPLQPSGRLARLERNAGVIEGKLTRVDGRTETVDVSVGLLGLLGKTIEVNRDTLIQVNGRDARFADLHEGAKVKAFYEERGAKLVGTRLEVTTGG